MTRVHVLKALNAINYLRLRMACTTLSSKLRALNAMTAQGYQ